MIPLTQKSLALAARELAARDEMLAAIHASHGDPPLWRRATGFSTLAHIILEQQVSLKSAKAMLVRLEGAIEGVLTTLVQPAIEKGRLAAEAVLAALAGREGTSAQLHSELRVGTTSGPVPAS